MPRPIVLCAAVGCLSTVLLATVPPAPASALTVEATAASAATMVPRGWAQIRRTAYGIPHILAGTYRDLGYGYGYAFAADNLCTLAGHVVTLRGDRSRYFGPSADSGEVLDPATNLDSDVYYRTIMPDPVVRALLAQPALGPSRKARDLVAGYAEGYNRYLRDTGVDRLPDPTCRGAAWVCPSTDLDLWRVAIDLARINGTGQLKSALATATPPAGNATSTSSALPNLEPRADLGSNAIATGRAATRSGDGELLANPHFPWTGAGRFYQVQLTIPGQLNVSGAGLYGTPLVEIGHTEHLAWSHTVSTARRFTLYQLALVQGDPTSYLVDGVPEAMAQQQVTVPVLGADGQLSDVTRTVYRSRYGPVLSTAWTASSALAIRDANADNVRAIDEWLAMDQSQSVAQLRSAQDTYQALPFVNTVATDATGTAYYADASVVPHVTDAMATQCVDTPLGRQLYPTTIVLDGATTGCDWGTDPDAVEPGLFGPSNTPRLTRTDWVENSNASPWLTNPAQPLGYPAIFGDTGTTRPLRTRLAVDMIDQRVAGTDGLGPAGFTLASLQATALGDRDLSGELGRDAVVGLCRAHPLLTAGDGSTVDVSAACGVLAAWDLRTDPDSTGAVLWRQFWLAAMRATDLYLVPFDPASPLTTPNTVNTDSVVVRQALADAVAGFQTRGLPLDLPLRAAQRVTVAGTPIPVPGCGSSEGCFNVVQTAGTQLATDGGYPDVYFGSSFIMAVELTGAGPVARTILTYSLSANPDSPHHADQTLLFSTRRWVPERFTEAAIAADPQLDTTLLRR